MPDFDGAGIVPYKKSWEYQEAVRALRKQVNADRRAAKRLKSGYIRTVKKRQTRVSKASKKDAESLRHGDRSLGATDISSS
ncbi:hypothetical protein ES703_111266 [subsurface metagenome]